VVFGALGDIHGDFASLRLIIRRHPDVAFWLCVGDVADSSGGYEPADAPLYWIKGNNENFDRIASGDLPAGHHYIPNGTLSTIQGVRVAGLGGTFAPTMYETAADTLPHPVKGTLQATALADRRRHFVRQEVEACKLMTNVDVLLTHEAPRPFRVAPPARGNAGAPTPRQGNDAGKTPINEVLAAVKPRLHLFGHHHRFAENDVQGVRSICLDLIPTSYLLIDAATLKYDVMKP
jgi:Icc-related predicted phosphoesterase